MCNKINGCTGYRCKKYKASVKFKNNDHEENKRQSYWMIIAEKLTADTFLNP